MTTSNAFNTLPLRPELLENLQTLKFDSMTPIQEQSLPFILEGKNIIAQAKTGSGKTAAFGLGILKSLDTTEKELHAFVLCPTRELADQVAAEIRMLARSLPNVKITTLCGGTPESLQEKSLNAGAHIAVGTPGRVLQHLKKKTLKLYSIDYFTLDEADRMLDMGFEEELNEIITYLPKRKQSLLFSATYPDDIRKLSESVQDDAVEIKIDVTHKEDNINQIFYEVRPTQDKNNLLYKILSQYKPDRAIVFCRTKRETADVAEFLANRKIYAQCINGDLEQNERTDVLTKFSNRSLSILVATDVAARGLDIEDLAAVVNYNLPPSADDYVHRVGRTGRAGKKGLAFSFFNPIEEDKLEAIEDLLNKPCNIENPLDLSYTEKYSLTPPMRTMYISGGKKDKLRPGDIVGALVNEAKIDAKDIGDISVLNAFSYVAIKRSKVEKAISKLSHGKIKKKKFKVGLA